MKARLSSLIRRARKILPYRVRQYLYGVGVAAVPILALCHVIKAEAVPVIAPMLVALLHVKPDPDE